jgi:hypothetical protein
MRTYNLFFLVISTFIFPQIPENCFAQWIQAGNPNNSSVLTAIISNNNIIAGTFNGAYISTDNGVSWSPTALSKSINSLKVSGNKIFAGTGNATNSSGIYVSTDGGFNWVQTSLNNKWIHCIEIGSSNLYAGSTGVYVSSDNGVTWTITSLNNKSVESLTSNGENIFAGTSDFLNPAGVYISTNGGVNWTQSSLNNKSIFSLNYNNGNLFAGTSESGIYISTNNGDNWAQTTLNNQKVYTICSSGNNVFAGTAGNGVYFSTNNGNDWLQKNQGFSTIPAINSLIIVNNFIYAGTNNSIWLRLLSEAIGILNINHTVPPDFSLAQNYPNPFNQSTIINFQCPEKSNVSLNIYDISGKNVKAIINRELDAGTYSLNLNIPELPSGVYFYKLQTNKHSDVKKMILSK